VIDDYPQIVASFGGVCIKEYLYRDDDDQEMYAVLAKIDAHPAPVTDPSLAAD
jgi:hypothetical protein